MKGTVIKSTGAWCTVKSENGNKTECRIKGKFRVDEIKSTNPVAVGDIVNFTLENDSTGVIDAIAPRRNYIIRKATKLSKQTHIIAANIDAALLVVSLRFPETLTGFIDRFLVTCEAYSIPAVIVFNKIDLYDDKTDKQLKFLHSVYEHIGYKCLAVSAETGENINALKKVMEGKTWLLAGNSGVGKSTIINKIEPSLNLKISEVSEAHETGTHTTTFAEMFEISTGANIIDTPGLKSFGIVDFKKEDLFHCFPEMFRLVNECKFGNCTHTNEPGCAVKKAVEQSDVAVHRYKNYLAIYSGDELKAKYR